MTPTLLLVALAVAARDDEKCGPLLWHQGYAENLPGKPLVYAESAQQCCDFCHATAGCQFWTWNGVPPGNGNCYAKASNKTEGGGGSATMVSGGIGPSPPLPPPPAVKISLVGVPGSIISEANPTYASWNIDSSCNRGFHRTDFTNPNLIEAARGLSPSVLRFGGSGNDNLVYGLSAGSPECAGIVATDCGYTTPGCLNSSHWDALHAFAQAGEAQILFGISFGLDAACKGGASYEWDATNAEALLIYLAARGQRVFGFELGNEINNQGGPPCNLTASQQAAAMLRFATLVQATQPEAKLIGPDTGYREWQAWLEAYLPLTSPSRGSSSRASSVLHAVTHHVYPGASRASFNHPQALDSTLAEIEWYTRTIASLAPGAQVWAGEDGPIGGGNDGTCGSNSVCGTYADALWYADDMANRAAHGFVQYQRQTFFGGAYGLTTSGSPHTQSALGASEAVLLRPGYYTSFLWKRTLGASVLNASSTSPFVRAYAFRGAPPSRFAAEECAEDGATQLLIINLYNTTNVMALLALGGATQFAAWTLTPPAEGAFSMRVRLQEELLRDIVDAATNATGFLGVIPVPPVLGRTADGIELPALSVTFACAWAARGHHSVR